MNSKVAETVLQPIIFHFDNINTPESCVIAHSIVNRRILL